MKTLAIMQPYFLPYIGYWQLMNAADEFVVYDNIQYTKKGWISRNRFLQNGKDELFSIPLRAGSDYLNVVDRTISPSFSREKLLAQLSNAYKKAPHYKDVMPLVDTIVSHNSENLFGYIYNSLEKVKEYLNIATPLVISSSLNINHALKSQDKVIALCKVRNASTYINPIGGTDLYDNNTFTAEAIKLKFLRTGNITYPQFGNAFIPHLSILDVLMFNSRETVIELLGQYKLETYQ